MTSTPQSDGAGAPPSREASWRSLDAFDLAVLACLGVLSLAFLVSIAFHGGVFAGWEGYVVADQGQYLSWVRDAGSGLLVGNRFDLLPDDNVFLHPTLVWSRLLNAAGVSASLAYLLWKPVAVLVLFWGVWRYTRRLLEDRWQRRAALVLGLLFISPAAVIAPLWGGSGRGTLDFMAGEIWPAGHLWGYPMTAIAVGLTPLVFLWSERLLAGGGGRERLLAPAGALMIAWLHPWQGLVLVAALGLAGLWHARAGEADLRDVARSLAPTLAAALLPAVYYYVLSHVDDSWSRSEDVYRIGLGEISPAWLLLALGPLALPAALAYRGSISGFQERVLHLWAPLGFALYLLPLTPVRFHSFNGLSIPLSILAVRAASPYLGRLARRPSGAQAAAVLAVAAIVFLVVPGTVDRVRSARGAVYLNKQPFILEEGERDALEAIERAPGGGGVLSSVDFGALVPFWTGREAYVGSPSWSPDFGSRAAAVGGLLGGTLAPDDARLAARSSGARFILQDCRSTADLTRDLEPILRDSRRYGCATVLELRDGS